MTKQGLQSASVFKQTVQINAHHIALRVLPAQACAQHRMGLVALRQHGAVRLGLAVVDFVAGDGHAIKRLPGRSRGGQRGLKTAGRAAHGFLGFKHRDQRQQPQPRRVAVNAVRVN